MMEFPDTLYKYRGWYSDFRSRELNPFTQNLLWKGQLYYPSPSELNDPLDCSIPYRYKPEDLTPENIFIKAIELSKEQFPSWNDYQIHSEIYRIQQEGHINDPEHHKWLIDQAKKDIEIFFGVLSLSTSPDKYLMWSHYGNNHRGVCIGLDPRIVFDRGGGFLSPVIYQESYPYINFMENHPMEFALKILCTKGKFWVDESEYRFVKTYGARKSIEFGNEIIKELIFGVLMDHEMKIQTIAKIGKTAPHIHVYEMKLSENNFHLKKERIF